MGGDGAQWHRPASAHSGFSSMRSLKTKRGVTGAKTSCTAIVGAFVLVTVRRSVMRVHHGMPIARVLVKDEIIVSKYESKYQNKTLDRVCLYVCVRISYAKPVEIIIHVSLLTSGVM